VLSVLFFKSNSGNEPVRDWLRELSAADRKIIGEDIKTVQQRFGMGGLFCYMGSLKNLKPHQNQS
jgi:hypothetical protein